ncbi:LacI family transcriptional regulator [Cellulomonas sp. DKR-3]|uniref:LacI family transcriptional regulator n=1 Tax=Cellulomonas fulva TaxID=2835530 RepID=A0ABS5TXG8_9CELL|nr:LacI family DNA-binding transcriptional regulator [Cellulomonas fulva]MBT0993844.1 LacI family transcriptional regulator [Cellulomonas fulva]
MERAPSVVDVARVAGVSVGTVSNVLNRPQVVAAATRARVEKAIAELGFVRNAAARSLAAGSSRTIAFVAADLTNTFFLDLARGAEEILEKAELNLVLANCDSREDKQRAYLDLFEEERVAGLLVAPRQDLAGQVLGPRARGMRVVLLNAEPPEPGVCSVQTDNRAGGYLAARHLIELGRTRLLFAGARRFPAVVDRLEGARLAVAEAEGVTLEYLATVGVTTEDGRAVAESVLARDPAARPDGLLAGADLLALGVVQAAAADGSVAIPGDLAVVGYDNNRESWGSMTPLTTLDQAGVEMGREAARLLLEELREPAGHEHATVVMEPVLVPRASTLGHPGG